MANVNLHLSIARRRWFGLAFWALYALVVVRLVTIETAAGWLARHGFTLRVGTG